MRQRAGDAGRSGPAAFQFHSTAIGPEKQDYRNVGNSSQAQNLIIGKCLFHWAHSYRFLSISSAHVETVSTNSRNTSKSVFPVVLGTWKE
jgi:hypothetical protein